MNITDIDTALDGVKSRWDHGEAQHNPDMLALIRATESLREQFAATVRLVDNLIDEDACWFDHHGGCQAHGYLSLEPGEKCPQQEAKELVEANQAPVDEVG